LRVISSRLLAPDACHFDVIERWLRVVVAIRRQILGVILAADDLGPQSLRIIGWPPALLGLDEPLSAPL
jgi:hypothetical protein